MPRWPASAAPRLIIGALALERCPREFPGQPLRVTSPVPPRRTGQFSSRFKLTDSSSPPQTASQALSVTVIPAQSAVADSMSRRTAITAGAALCRTKLQGTDDLLPPSRGRRRRCRASCQNPKGRTTPIHVMVRAGSFYVTQPLSFTTADSGTSTLQVVWENYPNETPVISGGMRITNWTHGSGNEWQATLPSSVQY